METTSRVPLPTFTDEDLEAITCDSTWRSHGNNDVTSSSCQTLDLESHDVGITSLETFDASCQTKPLPYDSASRDSLSADFLADFRVAADRMLRELSRSRTKAFENYVVSWEEDSGSMSCLLTMNESASEQYVDMPVTALSWNSTGSVLAASHGHTDHNDWCQHKGKISLWNINRHDKVAAKPDNSVDLESCIMCVKFHDTSPGLLTAGTFSGDVLIWDLAKDTESNLLISDSQKDSQGDAISQVAWLIEKRRNNVMSISNSGRVTIWTIASKDSLVALKSFTISTPHSFKLRLKGDSVGASVLAVDYEDKDVFVLGTESGQLVKCLRDSEDVKAVFSYKSHNGPVYGLQYSSLIRNVFLTCGTDGCVNVYSTLHESPLVSIDPCEGYLYSCRFSPTNASILAVGGSRGRVVFYDLNISHVSPRCVLECGDKHSPVQAVEFNHKHTGLLACADGRGLVKVWNLGSELVGDGQLQIVPILTRESISGES